MSERDGLPRGRLGRPRGFFLRRAAGFALAIALSGPIPAHAFWFGRKKEPKPGAKAAEKPAERRYHMRVPDKGQERELLGLFARKQLCLQQTGVLEQLVTEKQAELAEFNNRQEREFSMKANALYEYDAASRTIYSLASQDPSSRKLHLQLVNDTQAARFAALNAGKQLVLDGLRVLNLLIAEKRVEIGGVDEQLKSRFSIRTDRNYQYEPKTMRLYELPIPPPQPGPPARSEIMLLAPAPVK